VALKHFIILNVPLHIQILKKNKDKTKAFLMLLTKQSNHSFLQLQTVSHGII